MAKLNNKEAIALENSMKAGLYLVLYAILSFLLAWLVVRIPGLIQPPCKGGCTLTSDGILNSWGIQWLFVIAANLLIGILSIYIGNLLGAKIRNFTKEILIREFKNVFGDITIFSLAMGLTGSCLIFGVNELFSIFKPKSSFMNDSNLIRLMYGSIFKPLTNSDNLNFDNYYYQKLAYIIIVFAIFLTSLLFVYMYFKSRESERSQARPEEQGHDTPHAIRQDELKELSENENTKPIWTAYDRVVFIALVLNNYFMSPSLNGDYDGFTFFKIGDYYFYIALVVQFLAAISLGFLFTSLKSVTNIDFSDVIAKANNFSGWQPRKNKTTTRTIVVGSSLLICLVIGAIVYAIPWNARNLYDTQLTSISKKVPLCPLDNSSGSAPSTFWTYASPTQVSIDFSQCHLDGPLTERDNFIAFTGLASQEGDVIQQSKLADERARTLAAAILSQNPNWKGTAIIINLGRARASTDSNASSNSARSNDRPINIVAGHVSDADPNNISDEDAHRALMASLGLGKAITASPLRSTIYKSALKDVQKLKSFNNYDYSQCYIYEIYLKLDKSGVDEKENTRVSCASIANLY